MAERLRPRARARLGRDFQSYASGPRVTTPLGEAGAGLRSKARELAACALVVDDEDDARELIETVLTQYGAEVVAASSAAEAPC